MTKYDEFPFGPGLSINELRDPGAVKECEHDRLPFDPDPPCGCFPIEKGGPVKRLPVKPKRKAA